MKKRTFVEALKHTADPLALLTSLRSGSGAHKSTPDHKQDRKKARQENRENES